MSPTLWSDVVLRSSIWIALGLFVAGECGRRASRAPAPWAWRVWTAGALVCAFHIAWAMGWWHEWSHASALAETAALTASVFGVAWGGGVYVNYAFLAVWLGEALWWWRHPDGPATRSALVTWVLRAFYFLIIVNAAVVFTTGAARLTGALLVGALVGAWLPTRKHKEGGASARPG